MNDHVKDHSSEFATWEADQKTRAPVPKATGQPTGGRAPQGDGIPVLEDVIRPGPPAAAAAGNGKAAASKPALATDPWPVATLEDPAPTARRALGGAAVGAQAQSASPPDPASASQRRRARSASTGDFDRLVEEAVRTALRAATPLIADIVTEQLRAQFAQQRGKSTGERKDPPSR